jgi:hypothetical protein
VVGDDLMPEFLRGRVVIVASAYDTPTMRVPGVWHDLPVTPALVQWRIERADTGKVAVPTRVAYDVRQHLPAAGAFWNVYARGTHQNMSVFGKDYSYMQPGVYRFLLTPAGPRHPVAAERRLRARRHRDGHQRQPQLARAAVQHRERRAVRTRITMSGRSS